MKALVALATVALLSAGCIQVGEPARPAPPVHYGGDLPDGAVPANNAATVASSAASAGTGAPVQAPPAAQGCEGDGPRYQVGDRWEYRLDDPVPNRVSIEARETHLGYDTYRLNLTMDETFYQIDGYADDPRYELRWVCAGTGAIVGFRHMYNQTFYQEVAYDEPCQVLRFPLRVGAGWTESCSYREAWNGRGWSPTLKQAWTVSVEANETLSLPVGDLELTRVVANTAQPDGRAVSIRSWHNATLCAEPVVWMGTDPYRWGGGPSVTLGLESMACLPASS